MLSVLLFYYDDDECLYTKCCYAECRYTAWRGTKKARLENVLDSQNEFNSNFLAVSMI